jgi:hypothetical protein
MTFELNSKNVVTRLHSKNEDTFEFGARITDCLRVYNCQFTNSHIKFIRREVNKISHALIKMVTSITDFHINNEML